MVVGVVVVDVLSSPTQISFLLRGRGPQEEIQELVVLVVLVELVWERLEVLDYRGQGLVLVEVEGEEEEEGLRVVLAVVEELVMSP